MLAKHRVYGPDQFTEEDVLVVKRELEREEPGSADITDHGDDDDDGGEDGCQKKWCSQCQVERPQKPNS